MSIDTKHPAYAEKLPDWEQMRDAHAGQRRIKEKGFQYLSPTSGMVEDGALHQQPGTKGWEAYHAYRRRARFPDLVREAVQALLGTMHNKPPTIELPPQLEFLRERATARGESLVMLMQRINEEQLVTGRLGLLADVIDSGARSGDFYLAVYQAEHVINWDEGQRPELDIDNLNLVVLDESADERSDTFTWTNRRKFRVLVLGDPEQNEPDGQGTFQVGVFEESFAEADLTEPSSNGRTAEEIPFVFINSQDIVPEPDTPPLLGLADLALTIYSGEADYRQSLFLQGQDTLVTIGASTEEGGNQRTGTGASINIANTDGDAKFIGVDSTGLSEQRTALENDRKEGREIAGTLIDSTSSAKESGDALRIRVAVRTATLNRVAIAGAFGLQDLLRKLARWRGLDPESVVVTPNLDFVDDSMTGKDIAEFMGAKMLGAPLSLSTIHRIMADRGVTEATFEEELATIEEEQALAISIAAQEAAEARSASQSGDPADEEGGEGDGEGGNAGGGGN